MELKTSNKKILEFYGKYKELDFETLNLTIIDLYENIIKDVAGDINKVINNNILENVKIQITEMNNFKKEINNIMTNHIEINNLTNKNLNNELVNIKDTLNKLNNEISNNVISKFFEIKQSYTEDLKTIVNKNDADNYIKITEKIEASNKNLIDKTCIIISDVIPKSQSNYYNQYENIIKNFKEDMDKNMEIIRLDFKDNKNELSIEKINNILETKYNTLLLNVQQSCLSYISSSEERINNNLNMIKETTQQNQINQDKITEDLNTFLNKNKVASSKGLLGENQLNNVLNKIFPTSEIINSSGMNKCADFILKRDGFKDILIETKDYNQNVNREQLYKFHRDIDEQKIMNGLFISHYTGIVTKNNYQIDINNGNVLVYIHNVEYNPDKILTAINIIDNLTDKLKELHNNNNLNNISDEQLLIINEQYQNFIQKRETICTHIRESTKKTLSYLTDMELTELNIILSSKFASTKMDGLKCTICNAFTGNNKKALSIHFRTCKKKHNIIDNDDVISDTTDNINEEIIEEIPIEIKPTEKKSKKSSKNIIVI
jgi:hypothetical protein